MPLNLGNRVISQHLTIDEVDASIVKANQLGTAEKPVITIHRASTDVFQNDLKFKEGSSGEVRCAIRTSGHLAIAQDLELHNSTDVDASAKAWTVGCNSSGDFVIRDELAATDSLTITQGSVFSGGGGGAPTSNPTFTGTLTVNNAGSTLGQLAVESHAVIGGDLVMSGQSTSITADTIQDSVGNHYKTVASTWNSASSHPIAQSGLNTHLSSSYASLSANNAFAGTQTFDEEVTFEEDVLLESGATARSDIIIKDGANNTQLTFANDGRIGIGATPTYGTSGHVLTSGGSGSVSWQPVSGGSGGSSAPVIAHTYQVTVANGKFVIPYLEAGSVGAVAVYNNEHHSTVSGNGKDFGFWLHGPGLYRLDQSDSTNANHPLKLSIVADGIHTTPNSEFYGTIPLPAGHTAVDAGVSYVGTPGTAGAYTEIDVRATPMGVGANGGYHTPDLYVYCGNHSGMGFGPIAVDFVGFRLQGLISELQYGITTGVVWPAIRSFIGNYVDVEPPVFTGIPSTFAATVGDTFNAFNGITCADSPTAGPNAGTTSAITLGASNFEFRDAVGGINTIPLSDVFDNLLYPNDAVYEYNTTTSSQVTVAASALNGFHGKLDEDQGIYIRFTSNSANNGSPNGNLFVLNHTSATSSTSTYPNWWIQHYSNALRFRIDQNDAGGDGLWVIANGATVSASQECEFFITWSAMSHSDTTAPDPSDIEYGFRVVGGSWSTGTMSLQGDQLESFSGSGTTSEYYALNASTGSIGINPGAVVPVHEVRLYNKRLTTSNLQSATGGVWQASSTWKAQSSYPHTLYLRYKAVDANGNETAKDAAHFTTVTLTAPLPPSPIYTRTTTAGINTTIAAGTYGAWKGWNATQDWSLVLTFTANAPITSAAAMLFEWTPPGCKIEIMMNTNTHVVYVNWQNLNSGQIERLEFSTVTSLTNAATYSVAITYDSTAYNAGPATIPDLSNGAQSTSNPLKLYLKAAGQGTGTYALADLANVADNWDNSHPRTFPPGDGSTAIKCPSWGYNGGSTPVSYTAFYNDTVSLSQLNSDH